MILIELVAFLKMFDETFLNPYPERCLHMNQKAYGPINLTELSRMKDFSRSQAVTYTVKEVISRKRCWIQTLLLQTGSIMVSDIRPME